MGAVDFMAADVDDRALIDLYRPGTHYGSKLATQPDEPGTDLQTGAAAHDPQLPRLPDPAVGGQTGSKRRYGMLAGIRSVAQRRRPFTGQVAKLPTLEANPVQGYVGRSNAHQAHLAAGVRDQLTNYTGSLRSFAESYRVLGQAVTTPVGTGLPGSEVSGSDG